MTQKNGIVVATLHINIDKIDFEKSEILRTRIKEEMWRKTSFFLYYSIEFSSALLQTSKIF